MSKRKLLVTHIHPDMDGIGAIWIFVRFLVDDFGSSGFAFVPAGQTYRNEPVDSDPEIVHVDTGGGLFDHHDPMRTHLSATQLVYEYVLEKQKHLSGDEALRMLVEHVTEIDQFGEYFWEKPLDKKYAFLLSNIIPSLHQLAKYSDGEVVELVMQYFDAAYKTLQDLIHSLKDVEKGEEFDSRWGKSLAIETGNDASMKVAQKSGYDIVVRKDPRTGFTKIKAAPKSEIDLRLLYDKIIAIDSEDRWYFHPGGHMLLNGSSKDPTAQPSDLTINQIVQLIKELS